MYYFYCIITLLIILIAFLPRRSTYEKFGGRIGTPNQLHKLGSSTVRISTSNLEANDLGKPLAYNNRNIQEPLDMFTPQVIDKHLSGIGIDSSFHGVSQDWEQGEAEMANKYMGTCKNILEVGGGSGKVSHYLNRNLKNPKAHYVVEPSVWDIGNHLSKNKKNHGDQYYLDKRKINDIPLSEIEDKIGKIDCIVSDCEGCMLDFYKKNPKVFTSVSKIMNEMDGHDNELRTLWGRNGFTYLVKGCGCGGCKCDTDLWVRGPNSHPSNAHKRNNHNKHPPLPQANIPRKHQHMITPRMEFQPPHRPQKPRHHPALIRPIKVKARQEEEE